MTKRSAIQGRPWPGTVCLPNRNSSMADDISPPEGETSLGLNPDERFIWHVVCLLISLGSQSERGTDASALVALPARSPDTGKICQSTPGGGECGHSSF